MRLVVLGSSGTYPRPGGACNGFLIQEKGTNLVLDLGNGSLSNLLEVTDFTDIDAVVITHMHIDHFGDLYPLYYALRFHPDEPWGLRLLLPQGGLEVMGRLMSEDSRGYLTKVYSDEAIASGLIYQVGDMKLTFFPTRHPAEGYSVRVEGEGWKLAYSSDTSPCPGLEEAAQGADIFICEATMPRDHSKEAERYGHMTAIQAGEMAEKAGARLLMLTHIWPTLDPRDAVEEAKEVYSGRVFFAPEGEIVRLGGETDAQE
jgi:ribonuclease BN (tRNA processing enzyme)